MKKVLVMTSVILGLSAMAYGTATPVIQVQGGGSTLVSPGQVVTIEIIDIGAIANSIGINLGQTTTSAAGYAPAGPGTLNPGFDGDDDVIGFLVNSAASGRYVLIDRISGVINAGSPAIPAGAFLYSFPITIPALAVSGDTFTLDDLFGMPIASLGPPYGTVFDVAANAAPLTLTVIPEPITIALLGLGGLFLRRRK